MQMHVIITLLYTTETACNHVQFCEIQQCLISVIKGFGESP